MKKRKKERHRKTLSGHAHRDLSV